MATLLSSEKIEKILNRPQFKELTDFKLTTKGGTILITGAYGSIGAHLAERLSQSDNNLYLTDIKEIDVTDEAIVKRELAWMKPDIIINIAGAKHAPQGEVDIEETYRINTIGVQNLLKHKGNAKLIQCSTCKSANPETVYGASKLIAERLVLNAGGVVARFFNVIETSFIDGAYSDSASNLNKWLLEGIYWIIFSSNDSNIQLYYNDTVNQDNKMLISNDNGSSWISINDTTNNIFFQASILITIQEDYHAIIAPGVYNLLGQKYITLRCPEIEQNSYRYLAYSKYFMGLAKFKLDTVGYNNQIIDFNDTGKREFHPIGKLNKLSFRFETFDNKIYDFKGVNHCITFAVYYYEPVQKETFKNSILNPNYKGNFIDYMYYQKEQEEDSDDQEFDYDRDNIENYKTMENKYNPDEIERIDDEIRYKSFADS